MKSLKHSGILVLPEYKAKGYVIFKGKKAFQLKDKQEEMAFAWCKKLGTPYVEDKVFRKNFFQDFCKELGLPYTEDFNFEQIIFELNRQKFVKENMPKEEKKRGIEERKKLREERKKKYGIAIVDGKEVEIANYLAEPSSIFMGRGKHPLRGRWKEGPQREDIILNLSPDAEVPPGKWKKIVWKSNKLWVASWIDKLSGKRKYVWLSDTFSKKQEREKAKFDKARKLEKNLLKIYEHIINNLNNKDQEKRKIATASLLIFEMNIRVGDEKDKDEADTVGCLTLRPEHLLFSSEKVIFDFLGKDSILWHREIILPGQAVVNLKKFMKKDNSPLFKGLTSKQVTKFLNEIQEGLTAKVFRTFRATSAVKEYLKKKTKKDIENLTEKEKRFIVKRGVLEAAKICNHKKALPKNFEERLNKKHKKYLKLLAKRRELRTGKKKGNLEKINERIRIAKEDKLFYQDTAEWNLNTSLKSYVSPEVLKEYCDKIDLPYEKIYSKTLLKKFSWCLK